MPCAPRLRFEVEDTGVGIPQAAQAGLFERFHQGDSSTTRRFGGSGLGLAITRRLAQMMGGEVGFTSFDGKGSTFWMEIEAPATDAPAIQIAPSAGMLNGLRILVVDDNATHRMIASKILEIVGAEVSAAESGVLGVAAATAKAFDLVLMDVQMPDIDGLEATRRIRALGGPLGAVPIIALTANALSHQRASYVVAGMDGMVAKPIAPTLLFAEIARVMALQQETKNAIGSRLRTSAGR
jgi:CheY-like chemotaxis protein